MLRKLNYGAAREGQKSNKSNRKVGRKSRSVNETGSKLSNLQEEAKGKAQKI